MEIWHRIALNGDTEPEFLRAVKESQIKYEIAPLPGHAIGLVIFNIPESDPRWTRVEEMVKRWHAPNMFDTIFTKEEILDAAWVRLIPAYQQGYPEPQNDKEWERLVYEGDCPKCGAGYWQKAPFRIAKEPRLGKRDFMSLNWIYAWFGTARVLEAFRSHQIRGYEVWPLILHRSGQPSAVVSQLYIPHLAHPGLAEEDKLEPESCPQCGLTKYRAHLRGYMHLQRDALLPDLDIMQSHEWFGSGSHAGFREILISNRLARLIVENDWKGVRLKPVILV